MTEVWILDIFTKVVVPRCSLSSSHQPRNPFIDQSETLVKKGDSRCKALTYQNDLPRIEPPSQASSSLLFQSRDLVNTYSSDRLNWPLTIITPTALGYPDEWLTADWPLLLSGPCMLSDVILPASRNPPHINKREHSRTRVPRSGRCM